MYPQGSEPCSIGWLLGGEHIFVIGNITPGVQGFPYHIDGTQIESYVIPPFAPQLHDRSTNDRIGIYVPSPNGNRYVYEQCAAEGCEAIGEIAVYDKTVSGDILLLSDASFYCFLAPSGACGVLKTRPSLSSSDKGVAWSNNSNYLAYAHSPDDPYQRFDLRVYDFSINQNSEPQIGDPVIDYDIRMSWSPDNEKLVFWTVGRYPESDADDDLNTLRTAWVYDVRAQITIAVDSPYNVQSLNARAVWSPDSTEFVFVDVNGNLIRVDANSGTSTTIDMQVSQVVSWRFDNLPQSP